MTDPKTPETDPTTDASATELDESALDVAGGTSAKFTANRGKIAPGYSVSGSSGDSTSSAPVEHYKHELLHSPRSSDPRSDDSY